jgi:uncharacterized membrane protein YphA (DoxX/SURF4 family)
MLGAIFLVNGADAIIHPDRLVPRAKRMTDRVASTLDKAPVPLPTEPRSLVRANGAIQVASAILLQTPLRRPAAVVLAASLVPTTVAGHAFWHAEDTTDRAQQRIHFLKNVGLFGGLLLAAVDTGGQPSLRWRASHLKDEARRSARRTARNTRSKTKIAMKSAKLGHHIPDWHISD